VNALIIASGQGSRLKTKGDLKPLVLLLGLPLIERVILTSKQGGIKDFFIVIGYNHEKLQKHLTDFSQKENLNITFIQNDDWKKENGISVLKAKDYFKENFILLMCDHIFESYIIEKLINQNIKKDEIILAVDLKINGNKFVNLDDVTKILITKNIISDIGKTLKNYNAFDTGIFLCSPSIFKAIQTSIKKGFTSLSAGVKELAQKGKVKPFDISNNFWIDVDDEKDLKKAKNILLASLGKSSDGPVSRYLNRPISIFFSKTLVKTSISPNSISFVSFLFSVIAASFFFLGEYIYLVTGGIIAQFASIIDGCDGEIARLKFKMSMFGGWFDAVLDRYSDAFLLFGLTYYVYQPNKEFTMIVVGFLAIIGTFMNSYTADKYDSFMKRKLRKKGNNFRMGRDVRIFILFLFCVFNMPFPALIIIAILMNFENIRRVVLLYSHE